jgi:hypothetical protein
MKNRVSQKLGALLLVAIFGLSTIRTGRPTAVNAAQQAEIPEVVLLDNDFQISFDGVEYHGDGTSTWSYTVEEMPAAKDLSNWVLETPFCAPILDAGPEPWEIVDPDPNAQLSGVKWETGDSFEQGGFWVTLETGGQVGVTNVAAKGPKVSWGQIAGPSCVEGEPPTDPPGEPPGEPGDEEPPTIVWVEPVVEFGVYDVQEDATVNLLVTAADNVGVVRVEFLRWDALKEVFVTIAMDEGPPYQATVPAEDLNPTWNQVFAASFDAAKNQSDWEWIWLYRVTEGPLFQPPETNLFIPLVIR